VTVEEAKKVLAGVKSLDDNVATLERTLKHLTDNGVDFGQVSDLRGTAVEVRPGEGSVPGFAGGDRDGHASIPRRVRLPDGG